MGRFEASLLFHVIDKRRTTAFKKRLDVSAAARFLPFHSLSAVSPLFSASADSLSFFALILQF